MKIIRYAGLKPQPWRDGGGVTREVAAFHSSEAETATPAETGGAPAAPAVPAQDAGWQWRVSIADVSKAGAFSPFPGMDRLLTVVDGDLLLLSVDGVEHPLEKYRPFRFSGDAASSSTLPTGDVRNLNVITRSGAFKGYTSIVELSKKRAHPVFEGQLGILLQGQATVSPDIAVAGSGAEHDPLLATDRVPAAGPETLERYDAVVGSDTATPEILGRGFLAVVSIDRVAGGL
jgi:environmental stress-induced protein Ves